MSHPIRLHRNRFRTRSFAMATVIGVAACRADVGADSTPVKTTDTAIAAAAVPPRDIDADTTWQDTLVGPAGVAHPRDMKSATPIKVNVRVVAFDVAGDTGTVTYVVDILAKPVGEPLWTFFVKAPAISVLAPKGNAHWKTDTLSRDERVAKWALEANTLIAPGTSTPPLTYRAVGVPDLVKFWAVPNLVDHPPVGEEQEGTGDGSFKEFADSGLTIGMSVPPAGTNMTDLVSHLRRLVNFTCGGTQLVAERTVCHELRSHLVYSTQAAAADRDGAIRDQIGQFITALNREKGKSVRSMGYTLLRGFADFIISEGNKPRP